MLARLVVGAFVLGAVGFFLYAVSPAPQQYDLVHGDKPSIQPYCQSPVWREHPECWR